MANAPILIPQPEKQPVQPHTLKERIEAHKGAGYGAMVGAIAGALVTGPFAPLGAMIGGALGGGIGSWYDQKFRRPPQK